jgi:hypothetical protein
MLENQTEQVANKSGDSIVPHPSQSIASQNRVHFGPIFSSFHYIRPSRGRKQIGQRGDGYKGVTRPTAQSS